jgi:nucleoside-diphosphate-sugar epimerase
MKVLVLGGAGYIGSVLCPYLVEQRDEVTVLDTMLYEKKTKKSDTYTIIKGDIRNINDLLPLISKADAVVNLAAISNDPSSDLKPELTWDINYKANELIAKLVRSTGKRVVYASSCSVYGFSEEGTFTEDSALGPVTLYAHTKMLSEDYFLRDDINGIVLRFATVYGYSEKPRFDLVVNTMTGTAHFTKKIVVNGGSQWRPIVHVKDVSRAIHMALHAENPKHRIYNVGSNEQNYQIKELGDMIGAKFDDVHVLHKAESADGRSYKVDFTRIREDLGFTAVYSVEDTVDEFMNAFNLGIITGMEEDEYFRVKYLTKYVYKESMLKRFAQRSYILRSLI